MRSSQQHDAISQLLAGKRRPPFPLAGSARSHRIWAAVVERRNLLFPQTQPSSGPSERESLDPCFEAQKRVLTSVSNPNAPCRLKRHRVTGLAGLVGYNGRRSFLPRFRLVFLH